MSLHLAVDSSQVGPGLVGFLIVVALAVALVFLIRSMNKQLRKVAKADFGQPPAGRGSGSATSRTSDRVDPRSDAKNVKK